MAHRFLYLAWLKKTWEAYRRATEPPTLRGRPLALTFRQYGAALLMAYLGEFSLRELAASAGVAPDLVEEWRTSPDFLQVMDWSKLRFARNFQEDLLLEDFSLREYQEIAGEFACLEESLRVRVRTGLYPQLRTLGDRLASQDRHGLPLETSWFPQFRRLFLFFWVLEAFWASPARPRLRDTYLPLARELVWPALGLGEENGLFPEPWENSEPLVHLKKVLAAEIGTVFSQSKF